MCDYRQLCSLAQDSLKTNKPCFRSCFGKNFRRTAPTSGFMEAINRVSGSTQLKRAVGDPVLQVAVKKLATPQLCPTIMQYIYIYLYINVFFGPSTFLLFRPRVFCRALGSVARREPARPRTQVWALAKVCGTCSGGSKSQVPSGRHSEHVESSRSLQTHVQVKRMSDGSCDIRDLECHQCRQTILTW